jgi:hypothetical protein
VHIVDAPRRPEVHEPANWLVIPRGRVERQQQGFRLPRETGDLASDCAFALVAHRAAETPEQHAAVRLRMKSLAERQRVVDAKRAEALAAAIEPLQQLFESFGRAVAEAAKVWDEVFRPMFDEPRPTDPRARALAARRNRNTGPAQQGRAPRSIGRASSGARR